MKRDDHARADLDWRGLGPLPAGGLDLAGWERVFRSAQVPLLVLDVAGVHAAIAEVRRAGVEDFAAWLRAHPDFITRAVELMRLVDVNEAAIRLNGAGDRDEMFDGFARLLTPDSLPGFRDLVSAIADGAEYHEGEGRFTTLDGRTYDAMNRAWIPTSGQEGHHLVLATFDITELKRAQDALSGSEERYRLLVETARDVIIRHDLTGRITFVNQAGVELTGRAADEIRGRDLLELVPEEIHPDMQERRAQRTSGHAGVFLYETYFLGRGGRRVPMEVSSTLIPGPVTGGGEPQVLIVARDISDRKRAEREQKELESRLQEAQRLESLGVLAGGIAHDFNNLLVTIMGNAELLSEDHAPGSPARESLEAILKASGMAADLCRQMQTYAGSGPISAHPCDLSATVDDIRRLLQVSVMGRSHVHFELAADLPPVKIDETQIRQVLMNLVANAAESLGEEGGEIMVRTGSGEASREELRRSVGGEGPEPGPVVWCEVQDSGCGMEPHVAARIFDPFYSTKFAGRGLGMSAALGIVKSHGGCFRIDTDPELGTTVRFLLPVAEPAGRNHAARNGGAPPKPVDLGGKLIMVVDDDPAVRKVGASFLRRLGCNVLAAGDGFEAIRVFGQRHADIDAVLMDFTMAGMDGLTTCRRLRVIRPDVPVVLSSGHDLEEKMDEVDNLAISGFVSKPFTLKQLSTELGRALAETGHHGNSH
jgi:PAS domain S-box-containing protein